MPLGSRKHGGQRADHEPERWGRTRCRKFLQSIGLSETKTIGSLTERQRVTLAALLTAKAQGARAQTQRADA